MIVKVMKKMIVNKLYAEYHFSSLHLMLAMVGIKYDNVHEHRPPKIVSTIVIFGKAAAMRVVNV
jgi:hypothetical protein